MSKFQSRYVGTVTFETFDKDTVNLVLNTSRAERISQLYESGQIPAMMQALGTAAGFVPREDSTFTAAGTPEHMDYIMWELQKYIAANEVDDQLVEEALTIRKILIGGSQSWETLSRDTQRAYIKAAQAIRDLKGDTTK